MLDQNIYTTPEETAISVNLDILAERLTYAADMAVQARDYMNKDDQIEAIIRLWRFKNDLHSALSLYTTQSKLLIR